MSYTSMELEAVDRLSHQILDDPQKLLDGAKTGSLASLQALVVSMNTKAFPPRLLPKTVDLFASVLRQHKKRPFGYDVVPVCIFGLTGLHINFFVNKKSLSLKVMQCWPIILDWIQTVGNEIIDGKRRDWEALEAAESALKAFSARGQEMEDAVLTLVTRLWLCLDGYSCFAKQLAQPAFAVISFETLRSGAQSRTPIPFLDRIYSKAMALGRSTESLVNTILDRLCIPATSQLSTLDGHAIFKIMDGIQQTMKSLIIISSGARDGAHLMFIRKGGVRRLVNTLNDTLFLLGLSTTSDISALKCASTFSLSLWIISYLAHCTPGIAVVAQVIRHGLLGVFRTMVPYLPVIRRARYFGQAAMAFLLSEVVGRALIFRSVAMMTHHHLRTRYNLCRTSTCSCTIPHDLAGLEPDLKDVWVTFIADLRHQLAAFGFFRRFIKKESSACSSCGTTNQRNAFRKCAGCNTALYCERSCQRVGWKAMHHGVECDQIQKRLESAGLSASDAHYLTLIAHEDARQRLNNLAFNSKCRKDMKIQDEYPLARRGLTIDYTKESKELHHFAIESRLDYDESLRFPTVRTRGRVDLSKAEEYSDCEDVEPDGTLRTTVEVVYPMGCEIRRLYFIGEFSGRAYHGDECTCCRYHGKVEDEGSSPCLTHQDDRDSD